MDVVALEGMSGGGLLDHAGDLATIRDRCEVEILRVAVQHALLHNPDTLDPAETGMPGRERARRCGGEGVPEVGEFAAAELGARLGSSTISAWWLMCEGLDLVYRLPKLWARVQAGEVRVHLARLVARKTRDLTEEQAAEVDARIAKYADGRLTWTRFQARLDGLVAAADPKATVEAERKAARQQVATPTRPDPENDHGLRGFYIKAPAATVLVFDAALQRIADILADLGDPAPVDQRGSPRCWSCRGRTWPPSSWPPTRPGPTGPQTPPGLRPRTPTNPHSPRPRPARPTVRSPRSPGRTCCRRW